jgi:hypothetical protein
MRGRRRSFYIPKPTSVSRRCTPCCCHCRYAQGSVFQHWPCFGMARPFAPEPQQWTSIWNGSGPDDSLFAELVTLHSPRLLRQLHQFTGSRVAHDLLQEVAPRIPETAHLRGGRGTAGRRQKRASLVSPHCSSSSRTATRSKGLAPLRAGFLSGAFAMAAGTGLARRLPAFGADRAGA